MIRTHWRRFRKAIRPARAQATGEQVERRLDEILSTQRLKTVSSLETLSDAQARRAIVGGSGVDWFVLLILRAPAAAQAQHQMDKHPHSYHTDKGRLYELIDFNDTYVSTVLALDPAERSGFNELAYRHIDRFCRRMDVRPFTPEQFEAITRGLTREIAVYLGARQLGYRVTMTSRTQDALGVDMVITEPASGRVLNIDCKTASAYHYRLQDLVREGRLTKQEGAQADLDGYVRVVNGSDDEAVEVTLLRVDPNEVGDIIDFVFKEPELLGKRLRTIFSSKI